MKEQFVTYEIAKKLQELGFREECLATIDQTEFLHIRGTPYGIRGAMCYDTIPCPLWQQLEEWLRNNKYIHYVIDINFESVWYFVVFDLTITRNSEILHNDLMFSTYEGAKEACIKKILERICENN